MKILSISQTQAADRYAIEHEPISSLDLMERAAQALLSWFLQNIDPSRPIVLICGKGNNGGDGLALARLLKAKDYRNLSVFLVDHSGSPDFEANLNRLGSSVYQDLLKDQISQDEFANDTVWVDALFGSGLSRVLEGRYATCIQSLNTKEGTKVAIDLPSGLMGDAIAKCDLDLVFKADFTLTFQYPKLALVHPYTSALAGQVEVLDIGLHPNYIQSAESRFHWSTLTDIKSIIKPRKKHSYKGDYGHAYLLAGSPNTMGAALIAGEACARSGAGLISLNTAKETFGACNSRLPELMLYERSSQNPGLESYHAIVCGPGLGQDEAVNSLFKDILQYWQGPLVLDADALNLIAKNPSYLQWANENWILTPHPGEFKRLLGLDQLGPDQLDLGIEYCRKHHLNLLLKGSISVLIESNGDSTFFDFGSSALAKGGSGDLLAGLICGLLAQGYTIKQAVGLGMALQGRAAQIAEQELASPHAVLSSDILNQIGKAYASF
ncbi:NAD(P)H-hydrate dehydratase [Croceimicrobium sp.]|uniref:NAD(P)H-hydrate dehydratase n=1 Tax=Croceimicrobium sp. TaxID=2828340 RepID=UPI003BACE804